MHINSRTDRQRVLQSFSLVVLIVLFALAVVSESFAQRGGRGGGYGSYNTYRSTSSNSYRSYTPTPPSPRYTQQSSYSRSSSSYSSSSGYSSSSRYSGQSPRQIGSSSYPRQSSGMSASSRPALSAPRAHPKSISETSPVLKTSAFSGKVTKAGSPIIKTNDGKIFSIPQQGVMSSKMSLMSGAGKSAVTANLGKISFNVQDFKKSLGYIAIDKVASMRDARAKANIQRILATKPGLRAHPDSYTTLRERLSHAKDFSGGYTKIVAWEPNGEKDIGDHNGTFVLPTKVADKIIKDSNGDPRHIEKMLGLEPHSLGKTPYRIDINDGRKVRMPTGNESGINVGWIPGGKTLFGIREGVVDKIEPERYKGKFKKIYNK